MGEKKVKNRIFIQLISLLVGVILILCIGLAVTRHYVKDTIQDNVTGLNEKVLLQINGKTEEYYNFMKSVAISVAYSPTVTEFYQKNTEERVIFMDKVTEVFSNAILIEPDIAGIYLYDMSMKQIAGTRKSIDISEMDTEMKSEIEFGDIVYLNQADLPYYKIYFPIYDLESVQYHKQIGTCVLLMNPTHFYDILENTQVTEHTEIYLIDKQNQIISHIGGSDKMQFDASTMQSNQTYMVTIQPVKMTGWRVISRIPVQEMKKSAAQDMYSTYIAYALAIFFVCLLGGFCMHVILHRIREINRFLRKNIEEPELRMQITSDDELGNVAWNLNQLFDERERANQEVIDSHTKMYEMEISKKQLQILAYQNQINPHFLYNTFDCIRSLAWYHDADDIAEIMTSLSSVFQFAVKGDNVVSVEEELNYIEEYARIIDYRFMGKIRVCISAEEDVFEKKVIKLLLQPIVENAVVHGLERQATGGEVHVTVESDQMDHLKFVVEDNGCGIDAEQLEWIRINLDTQHKGKGIGMSNIYQRLKLFYGEDVVFDIDSTKGEGTRITIVIPDDVGEVKRENV